MRKKLCVRELSLVQIHIDPQRVELRTGFTSPVFLKIKSWSYLRGKQHISTDMIWKHVSCACAFSCLMWGQQPWMCPEHFEQKHIVLTVLSSNLSAVNGHMLNWQPAAYNYNMDYVWKPLQQNPTFINKIFKIDISVMDCFSKSNDNGWSSNGKKQLMFLFSQSEQCH